MRAFSLVFFLVASVYASELIFVSNDTSTERLESLHQKYGQVLLVNDTRVYLISSECTIERYYGGTSQGTLNLVKAPTHTKEILVTQEVFEAKDEKVITQKIELDKSVALIEGKVSKEFLADKEGRAFGGVSELPRDMTSQKLEAKQIYMKTETVAIVEDKAQEVVPEAKPFAHPTCQLLLDGSGYELIGLKNAQFYSKNTLTTIEETTILFK